MSENRKAAQVCKICNEYKIHIRQHIRKVHDMTEETYYDRYLRHQDEGFCHVCGSLTKFDINKFKYQKFCSNVCLGRSSEMIDKKKSTSMKNYGVEHGMKSEKVKNKLVQTNLKNHGIDYPFKKKEIKDKIVNTNIKKYGVDSVSKVKSVRDKAKQTMYMKYGAENPMHSEELLSKLRSINLKNNYEMVIERFKNQRFLEPLFSSDSYDGLAGITKWRCLKCNSEIVSDAPTNIRCYNCFPKYVSDPEMTFRAWISSVYKGTLSYNDRTLIKPKELDIIVPELKLAIEFDGLYYHSELAGGISKNYHLEKTKLCEVVGYELIHIFEDEWFYKSEIVKSIILNKLNLLQTKIDARKCKIVELTYKDVKKFLYDNHLQGPSKGKDYICLTYNSDLVYCIVLGKSRFDKNINIEILRSCAKINTIVRGGFSKLIKYCFEKYKDQTFVSYADKRYFNRSNTYESVGFKYIKDSPVNYFYLDPGHCHRESRIKYQKHKISNIETKHMTEWELMQNRGYDRIWDCGNKIYIKRR